LDAMLDDLAVSNAELEAVDQLVPRNTT